MKKVAVFFPLLFLASILFSGYCNGQTDTTAYEHTYGGLQNDYARQIISTSDSGFIVVGSTSSFGCGLSDVYLIKLDSNCNKQWSHTYGSAGIEWGYSIRQTFDNGYVVGGYTSQDTSKGYDVYLFKTNISGTVEWERAIGGPDWDFGFALELTLDSGIIICGTTYNNTHGGSDVYIVKTDASGNLIWQKRYGGCDNDSANAIIRDRDNNYIVVGQTRSCATSDADFYILKINNNGDTIWTKTYGTPYFDIAYAVDTTIDGNYLVVGTTYGPNPDTSRDILYIKVDTAGGMVWSQLDGGPHNEEGRFVKELKGGDFFIGGTTQSYGNTGRNIFLHHFDSVHNFLGGNNPGGSGDDEGFSVALGKDNRFALAGITNSEDSPGPFSCGANDAWIIRINSTQIVPFQPPVYFHYCDTPLVSCMSVGIKERSQSENRFTLFPNPAHEIININIDSQFNRARNNYEIKITDIAGREIESVNAKIFPVLIQRNELANGIYLIAVYNNGDLLYIDKLILY